VSFKSLLAKIVMGNAPLAKAVKQLSWQQIMIKDQSFQFSSVQFFFFFMSVHMSTSMSMFVFVSAYLQCGEDS